MSVDLNGSAVVVDSPLPSTPLDAAPIEGAAPDITGDLDAQAVDSSTGQDAAPSPEQQELARLSEVVGLDLSGFSNPKDATAAARLIAEQYAQAGLQPQYPQQFYQQAPVPTGFLGASPVPQGWGAAPQQTQSPIDTILADETVDPKVKLQLQTAKQQYEQQLQYHQAVAYQQQAQFQAARQQEIVSRATSAIDRLASPKYGVGQRRTAAQQVAAQNVMRVAESIIDGMVARGAPIPTIEKVIQLATLLDGQDAVSPKAQGAALQQKSQSGGKAGDLTPASKVNKPYDPLGIMNDPSFRAGLRAIKAKY